MCVCMYLCLCMCVCLYICETTSIKLHARDCQGHSQTKCDDGASQLQLTWPITNLYVIRQNYSHIFKTKVHCSLLMHEPLANVPAA